jgi:hypothetical protein
MSNTDTILAMIHESSGLTDAELVRLTGIRPHQQVNQICNRLARNGHIRRERDARGLLVNRPVGSAPDSSQLVASLKAPRPSEPGSRCMRSPRDDLEDLDPATTLLVIACSGSKVQDSPAGLSPAFGPSILESIPEDAANQLRAARADVRRHVTFDEHTLIPALNRYSGSFYQAGRPELARALDRGLHALIISGGYGVLAAREPIGWYDAAFNPSWWPGNVVADCLSAYATRYGLTSIVAFLAASTGYARAFRGLDRSPDAVKLDQVFLVSAVAGDVGGAMRKVPHTLGEAIAGFVRRDLKPGWRSSDGLDLAVSRVR